MPFATVSKNAAYSSSSTSLGFLSQMALASFFLLHTSSVMVFVTILGPSSSSSSSSSSPSSSSSSSKSTSSSSASSASTSMSLFSSSSR